MYYPSQYLYYILANAFNVKDLKMMRQRVKNDELRIKNSFTDGIGNLDDSLRTLKGDLIGNVFELFHWVIFKVIFVAKFA